MKPAITTLLLTICSCCYAQKAFEFENYCGKTKNFEIRLALANGYIFGSEIIKTDLRTNKRIRYIVDAGVNRKSQNLIFLPDSTDRTIRHRKRDNIILYRLEDEYNILPNKIGGIHRIDLSSYSFTLYRQ